MFKIYFTVEKKITVNKNINELKAILTNFSDWNKWSPWLVLDDHATTKIENPINQVGHKQSWEGKLIGSGDMILSNISDNRIEMNLIFKTPFKSEATVRFDLVTLNEQTEVIWKMQSSLPFFLFFMKKQMSAMIASSFSQGLLRLKDLCEQEAVKSQLSPVEQTNQEAFYYIGERAQFTCDEIPTKMEWAYGEVAKKIAEKNLPTPDGYFAIYHLCDLITNQCDITAGMYYKNKINEELKVIPAHRSLKVIHKGGYHHLPTAWSKIITHQRGNKIKVNKDVSMYEFYLNNPHDLKPEDFLTELRLPIT